MRSGKLLRISQVGLRGIVGEGLTAAHVIDFASAFGTFLEPTGPVLIARDPRTSGCMIREGVLAALLACGHRVLDLGIASTPILQHAIHRNEAAGGISIGASHNVADWNALKFFGKGGTYLSTGEANELLDIYHLRKFRYCGFESVGVAEPLPDALDAYLAELASVFDFDAIRSLRVLVDCCNGTSAPILRRLNDLHGFSFILINERSQGGAFAHDPLITPETLELQLAPLIKPLKADVGFLFDVDSDRVGMATEAGQALSEEWMLPLLADHFLPTRDAKLVITNLSTTMLVDEVARRHQGTVVRVPVGRQAAIDALATYRPEQVALAGEGTGAVMLPQFRFVYDGIASMLAVLSMMATRKQTLSELVRGYSEYHMQKAQLPLTTTRVPTLLNELRTRLGGGRANLIDGLRVDWPDRWVHIRVSQTEPVVRVIAEQRGAPPDELFESVLSFVRGFA
jgi:phosphomannomutase